MIKTIEELLLKVQDVVSFKGWELYEEPESMGIIEAVTHGPIRCPLGGGKTYIILPKIENDNDPLAMNNAIKELSQHDAYAASRALSGTKKYIGGFKLNRHDVTIHSCYGSIGNLQTNLVDFNIPYREFLQYIMSLSHSLSEPQNLVKYDSRIIPLDDGKFLEATVTASAYRTGLTDADFIEALSYLSKNSVLVDRKGNRGTSIVNSVDDEEYRSTVFAQGGVMELMVTGVDPMGCLDLHERIREKLENIGNMAVKEDYVLDEKNSLGEIRDFCRNTGGGRARISEIPAYMNNGSVIYPINPFPSGRNFLN